MDKYVEKQITSNGIVEIVQEKKIKNVLWRQQIYVNKNNEIMKSERCQKVWWLEYIIHLKFCNDGVKLINMQGFES